MYMVYNSQNREKRNRKYNNVRKQILHDSDPPPLNNSGSCPS